jgi:hypothetical protein
VVALLGVAGMFAEERRQRVRIKIAAHIRKREGLVHLPGSGRD